MDISRHNSSPWMIELHNQLVRGNHVILHGNVSDVFLVNGRYLSLSEFLNEYLRGEGYQLVGWYDIVDGLRLAAPEMEPAFLRVAAPSVSRNGCGPLPNSVAQPSAGLGDAPASTSAGAGTPWSCTPGPAPSASPSVPPASRPLPAARMPSVKTPEDVLPLIRQALRQAETPVAMIIDFGDKFFSDPQRLSDAERETITLLKKIAREAAFLQDGQLEGRKNCLVIVAEQLAAVPPWLLLGNSFVSLRLPKPSVAERRRFVELFCNRFHEGAAISAEDRPKKLEQLTDNTDGLTLWDLNTMLRMSVAEKISVRKPKKLAEAYKFGPRDDDPWEKLDDAKIREARERLEARVFGQPQAVDAVLKTLSCAVGGISCSPAATEGGQPKVLVFCGPTGVGKTELAKSLSELLFGDESAFARFDMSEFRQDHSDQRLIGSPPGYVGSEEGGQLTNRCFEAPFSLYLFDEVDKAHPRVLDLFLQILEDGRLTDSRGKTAFFSKACLVFTSNIGGSTLDATLSRPNEDLPDYPTIRDHYLNEVRRHFIEKIERPELLNRFGGNIVVFDIIRPEHVPAICRKFLALCTLSAQEKHGVRMEFGDGIVQMICQFMRQRENFEMGGRRIKTLIQELVLPDLNRWVLLNRVRKDEAVRVDAGDGGGRILVNGKPVP